MRDALGYPALGYHALGYHAPGYHAQGHHALGYHATQILTTASVMATLMRFTSCSRQFVSVNSAALTSCTLCDYKISLVTQSKRLLHEACFHSNMACNCADAVGGLRPLAEGRVITKLLTSARLDSASARHTDSTTMSDSAVSEVAGLYHVLLLALPQWEKDSSQEQGQIKNGLTCALVSGLAFGCNILQTLWRCAAAQSSVL